MTGMKATILGALLVVALLVAAVPAAAHERTLSIEIDDDARLEIRSETEISADEVDFRFKAEHTSRPKLAVEVEKETENETVEVEVEIEFSATFREVFEFEDANGNGVYDPEEALLSSVRLDNLTFAPIEVASHSADGIVGFKVTMLGTQDGFSFGLVSYIFPSSAQINGTLVPEQAVKVDILLEGYRFTSDTSLLGLEIRAESSVEQETEFEDGSEEVRVNIERGTAFFEWAPVAQVDGQSVPVTAQWQAEGDRLFLYYPHGDVIVHDPMMGFKLGTSSTFLNSSMIVMVGVLALTVVALGIVVFRRKSLR
ncbi:MAG: hypothetical protein V3W22_03475 [Thermoplasmata archaeon]